METVKAADFKARCLALMDEVARTGRPITITKHGKPVAELVPCGGERPKSPFGMHQIKINGDIIAPVGVDWDALK
ncbi:MAG: type II toxin-antitoxin system Phd/YefM family antitoxin [Burkholderiales bacterium]